MGQEWDGEFLLGELEPVECLEPSVVFDVIRSILEAAIALGDIGHKQVLHNTLSVSIISQNRSKLLEQTLDIVGGKITGSPILLYIRPLNCLILTYRNREGTLSCLSKSSGKLPLGHHH